MKRADIGRPKLVALEVALRAAGEAHAAIVAAGIWTKLDHLAAAHAPIGDVGRFTDAHIATACGWTADGAWLVRTLLETGWLLPHAEHRLVLADWWEDSDDCHHRAVWRMRLRFWDGRAPRLTKLGAPGTKERVAAEAFYGLGAPEPDLLPITETLGSQAGSPSRPVPSFPTRESQVVVVPEARASRREPRRATSRAGDENERSFSKGKDDVVLTHRPVEPSWAHTPVDPPRSVAQRVYELRSRLRDTGDPWNLEVIARAFTPEEVERAFDDMREQARRGDPIRKPVAYFVTTMTKRARELGFELDFARRAVG